MANYTIFDNGKTRHGDPETLLEQIRVEAAEDNPEIGAMDVNHYADALIEDAPYFLDANLLGALEHQKFSKFERALNYLAQMPTSGVRILTIQVA